MKRVVLLLLAGLVFFRAAGASAAGDEPRMTASLSPITALIGDPVSYYLRVEAPPGSGVEIISPEPPGSEYETGPGRDSESPGIWERLCELRSFLVGEHTIPAARARVRLPGGEELELESRPLVFQVRSLIEEGNENPQPRDIRGPVEFASIPWLPILAGLALLLLGAGVWLIRRRRHRAGARRTPPPAPPHEKALAELEEIRRENLPGRGLVKEYYIRISGVVRHYLEDRFSLRAPERTTEEFLVEMAGSSALSPAHQGLVGDFLARADLVKFARYGSAPAEMEEVFGSAVRLVRETSPVPGGEGGAV